MLYPFSFRPIFKQRVWGGREIERLYHKNLPLGKPIGESWEITRPPGRHQHHRQRAPRGQRSSLAHGESCRRPAGRRQVATNRFPLLIKILDAQEKLSLQVHPPAARAAELGGEPKTEMWYIAEAAPGAKLYVGLKRDVTRVEFERRIKDGTVAECFHQVQVQPGDAMFLPSGRVHALGAGLIIFEIQQNSDTTYRVFDWNRLGLDGNPRELHVPQSLASIDFNDFEPPLLPRTFTQHEAHQVRPLVRDPLFTVDAHRAGAGVDLPFQPGKLQIIALLTGRGQAIGGQVTVALAPGQFCLLPASLLATLRIEEPATFLRVEL